MRRTPTGLIVSVALGVAAVAACESTSGPRRVEYGMDYPSYASIDELCDKASLVVAGTVGDSEVRNVNILVDRQGDTADENAGAYLVETVTMFTIDQVLRGALKPGDVIEVGQPGGLFEGVEYIAGQQYAMSKGEKHVLFLLEFDAVPANLLNPSQAGFRVTSDGTISPTSASSLAAAAAERPVGPDLCPAG